MTRVWFIIGMWLTSLAAWCIGKSIMAKGLKATAQDMEKYINDNRGPMV